MVKLWDSRVVVASSLVIVLLAVAVVAGVLGTRARSIGTSAQTTVDQCQLPQAERTGGWFCAQP